MKILPGNTDCEPHLRTRNNTKKTHCFPCILCVDVKSVNKATISNDLVVDNNVNTAISNVRVLKRLPKDSRVHLQIVCRTK